jgi:integrase/recombinase XerD
MDRIQRPKGDPPPITPFTEREIKALLTACDTTTAWHNRQEITSARRTALRDKAMVLLLVDTGIRVSELCRLTLANVDRITATSRS